jgi:hypothetical protein
MHVVHLSVLRHERTTPHTLMYLHPNASGCRCIRVCGVMQSAVIRGGLRCGIELPSSCCIGHVLSRFKLFACCNC